MDASTLEERFLKINKKLGMLAGVWPYQDKTSKMIGKFIMMIVMIPACMTQYARVIAFPRVDILLNDYPHIMVGVGVFVKYWNYSLNEAHLKTLIGKIYEDWRNTTSEDEYKIMVKYANRGVLAVTLYTLHIAGCILLFSSTPYVPLLLDIFMPLNETREHTFIYPAYYFVDDQEYYYWILLHMTITSAVLACMFCACDANYVYAVQHACGLLAITGYRFKHVCHEMIERDQKSTLKDMRQMYKNVCHSIRGHRRALKYVSEIIAAHETSLLIAVSLLVIGISASLLQISENRAGTEWIRVRVIFASQLFHVLILVIQGQFILDSYDNVYDNIYESTWYNSSPDTQLLYVLALRYSLCPPLLTAGGLLTMNLRTFAEIIKTSVSYYTVMQSV